MMNGVGEITLFKGEKSFFFIQTCNQGTLSMKGDTFVLNILITVPVTEKCYQNMDILFHLLVRI